MMGRAPSVAFALLLFALSPLTYAFRPPADRLPAPRSLFRPALMDLLDIRLSPGYCCDLSCSCTEIKNESIEQCRSIEDQLASLSPSLCSAKHDVIYSAICALPWHFPFLCANSTSIVAYSALCALPGRLNLCNGGAACCSDTCNDSCTSKAAVCACPCEHCSSTRCSCCKRVENRECWLQACEPCKRVWMRLDFQDHIGKLHSVNFSANFTFSSKAAQNFYDAQKDRSSIQAYFRIDDPNIVYVPQNMMVSLLDAMEEYPAPRFWVKLVGSAVAFPTFIIGILLTGLLFALLLQRRRRRADQRPLRIAWSVNRGLWICIIWSFIILLLTLQLQHRPSTFSTPTILFHQMMICIGWLPLLLMWLYHIMHPTL